MRSKLTLFMTGLLLVLTAGSALAFTPSEQSSGRIDEDPVECLEAVPAAHSIKDVTDEGQEIVLDVHFILDGLSVDQGRDIARWAAVGFEEIGIRLDPTFEEVSFPADGTSPEGLPSIDPKNLIGLAREHTGGFRPLGSDAVHAITSKELISTGVTGSASAGQADCIGGMRFPRAAFSVGELGTENTEEWNRWTGKIASHEVAHLMGAHHHYANCAQGRPDDIVAYLQPCTMMFNDVLFMSPRFSTLEAAVVRGHAIAFADNTQEVPDQAHRTLTAKVKKKRILASLLMEELVPECYSEVELSLEKLEGETWTTLETGRADGNGDLSFESPPVRGASYRAVAPASDVHDGDRYRTCVEAVSPVVTPKR